MSGALGECLEQQESIRSSRRVSRAAGEYFRMVWVVMERVCIVMMMVGRIWIHHMDHGKEVNELWLYSLALALVHSIIIIRSNIFRNMFRNIIFSG